jgi:hypothetical protein
MDFMELIIIAELAVGTRLRMMLKKYENLIYYLF